MGEAGSACACGGCTWWGGASKTALTFTCRVSGDRTSGSISSTSSRRSSSVSSLDGEGLSASLIVAGRLTTVADALIFCAAADAIFDVLVDGSCITVAAGAAVTSGVVVAAATATTVAALAPAAASAVVVGRCVGRVCNDGGTHGDVGTAAVDGLDKRRHEGVPQVVHAPMFRERVRETDQQTCGRQSL